MKTWLKSLAAAAIGGAATALSTMVVDPSHFNLADLHKLGAVAGAGAVIGVLSYLKQSPLVKD
jgi:predicted oxidoreductase